MGNFYGNITDTSNQIFQFDRIFQNRKAMDDEAAAGTDGIFTGHFVLVKYDNNGNYVLKDGKDLDYSENYEIDKNEYGENFDVRGYDGTVWQKIYSDGENKFIAIATLNGLMPTIELNPVQPSSTIPKEIKLNKNSAAYGYYKIDIPSQHGVRIKEADNPEKSDQQIIQTYDVYDSEGKKINTVQRQINADIYFNKDGFNKNIQSYSDDNNEILFSLTGESGKLYNGELEKDIQEVSIHIPAVGNVISNIYDKVYGVRDDLKRPLDTTWYDGNDIRRVDGDSRQNGKNYDLNTIAGVINTAHNRLGQIIIPLNSFPTTEQEYAQLEDKYIYFYDGKYYYKGKIDTYQEIDDNDISYNPVEVKENDYKINTYYIKDKNSDQYIIADQPYLYYPYKTVFYQKNISTASSNSLCVYKDIMNDYPVGYEWNKNALFVPASITLAKKETKDMLIELKGINNGESSINGSLLQFNKITNFNNINSRDINTVQGSLNSLNDQIYNIQNLQPQNILYTNNFGQISSSDYSVKILDNINGKKDTISNPEYVAEILGVAKSYYDAARNYSISNETPFYYCQSSNNAENEPNTAHTYLNKDYPSSGISGWGETENKVNWSSEWAGKELRNIDCSTYIGLILRGKSFMDTYLPAWKSRYENDMNQKKSSDENITESTSNETEDIENPAEFRLIPANENYPWSMNLGYIYNKISQKDLISTEIRSASQIAQHMEESGMAIKLDNVFTNLQPGDIIFWAKAKKDFNVETGEDISKSIYSQPNRYKKISHVAICVNKTDTPDHVTFTNKKNLEINFNGYLDNNTFYESNNQNNFKKEKEYELLIKSIIGNSDQNNLSLTKDPAYRQCLILTGYYNNNSWDWTLTRRVKKKEVFSQANDLGQLQNTKKIDNQADQFIKESNPAPTFNYTNDNIELLLGKTTSIKDNYDYEDGNENNPKIMSGNVIDYVITKPINNSNIFHYEKENELSQSYIITINDVSFKVTPTVNKLNNGVTCSTNIILYYWDNKKYPFRHTYYHCSNIAPYILNATLEKNTPEEVVLICRPSLGSINPNSQVNGLYSSLNTVNVNEVQKPGLYYLTNEIIDGLPDSPPLRKLSTNNSPTGSYHTLEVQRTIRRTGKIYSLTQTLWENFYRAADDDQEQEGALKESPLQNKGFWRRVQYCYSGTGKNGVIVDGEFNPNNWSPWEYYPSQSEIQDIIKNMVKQEALK